MLSEFYIFFLFAEDALLQEDMLEIMPAVEEANAISQELDKKMKFESMVVSPEARGELSGRTEVMIKATNIETKHEWIWPKVKFMNRKYVMQEMYNDFLDGDDPWELPPVSIHGSGVTPCKYMAQANLTALMFSRSVIWQSSA